MLAPHGQRVSLLCHRTGPKTSVLCIRKYITEKQRHQRTPHFRQYLIILRLPQIYCFSSLTVEIPQFRPSVCRWSVGSVGSSLGHYPYVQKFTSMLSLIRIKMVIFSIVFFYYCLKKIYLYEIQLWKEVEWEINYLNSQGWARPNPGDRASAGSHIWVDEA